MVFFTDPWMVDFYIFCILFNGKYNGKYASAMDAIWDGNKTTA